jgi:hypothetical protein
VEPIKTIKIQSPATIHTCIHCGHSFRGKLCNECGEKKFHPKQLSVHHFVHQAIDLFTHFESKVLKTVWLTIRRPGFVTQENLRGVRVPYAKPVQLFIIVNLCFYLFVSYLQRTDYVPAAYDNRGSFISYRPGLGWTAPLDSAIQNSIDTLRTQRLATYTIPVKAGVSYKAFQEEMAGKDRGFSRLMEEQRQQSFFNVYDQRVSFFSKTLIFLLIPVFAGLFYLVFHRQLVYYGAALILASHFLVFNLLFYMIMAAINHLPHKWFHTETGNLLISKGANALLYNEWTAPFSRVALGYYGAYEALHVIFLGGWLFFAFQRLFRLSLWKNLIVSYLLARLAFILIFSLYKKFLIAFTIWSL